MLGTLLGNYRVTEQLGEGDMGMVYLGQHETLSRRVVVKVLPPELSSRVDIVKRFFNEAQTAAAIRNPGIVQLFDFGTAPDGCAYLVTELLEGGQSLAARLAARRLDPLECCRIGRQVANVLHAAHAAGITHRNLKPESLFLIPDPEVMGGERVKVLDFGTAKLASEVQASGIRTRTGLEMGSPAYMSPEFCRSFRNGDARSDIYSLGCILFEMACGRPPFVGEVMVDVLGAQLHTPPPHPSNLAPHLPHGLSALISKMLSKHPDARPQAMPAVSAALDEVIRSLGGASPHPSSVPPPMAAPVAPTLLTAPPAVSPPPSSPPPSAGPPPSGSPPPFAGPPPPAPPPAPAAAPASAAAPAPASAPAAATASAAAPAPAPAVPRAPAAAPALSAAAAAPTLPAASAASVAPTLPSASAAPTLPTPSLLTTIPDSSDPDSPESDTIISGSGPDTTLCDPTLLPMDTSTFVSLSAETKTFLRAPTPQPVPDSPAPQHARAPTPSPLPGLPGLPAQHARPPTPLPIPDSPTQPMPSPPAQSMPAPLAPPIRHPSAPPMPDLPAQPMPGLAAQPMPGLAAQPMLGLPARPLRHPSAPPYTPQSPPRLLPMAELPGDSRDQAQLQPGTAGPRRAFLIVVFTIIALVVVIAIVAAIADSGSPEPPPPPEEGSPTPPPAGSAESPTSSAEPSANVTQTLVDAAPQPPSPTPATTEPAPVAAPPIQPAEIEAECRRYQDERKWSDLGHCAEKLRPHDPTRAAELGTRAAEETKSAPRTAAIESALRAKNLKLAQAELAQFWPQSVELADLKRKYAEAETQAIITLSAELAQVKGASCERYQQLLAKQKPAQPARVLTEATRRVPCTPPVTCIADAFAQKGQQQYAAGQYAAALASYESAYNCRPDPASAEKAFIMACNLRNLPKAKLHWKRLPPAMKQRTLMICVRNGITEDKLKAP